MSAASSGVGEHCPHLHPYSAPAVHPGSLCSTPTKAAESTSQTSEAHKPPGVLLTERHG